MLFRSGGETIDSRTVVWTAGIKADPRLAAWGLPTGRGGRVPVGPTLQVEGHPEVWAVGDMALATENGRPLEGQQVTVGVDFGIPPRR